MALPTLAQFNNIKEYLSSSTHGLSYELWVLQYKPERKKKFISDSPEFEVFWNAYPSTDHFIYNGKEFAQSRSMKSKKEVCKQLYLAAIAKGYTHQQMLHAVKVVILTKKIESYRKGRNELTYLSGLEPWLRSGAYINWLHSVMPVEPNKVSQDYSIDV